MGARGLTPPPHIKPKDDKKRLEELLPNKKFYFSEQLRELQKAQKKKKRLEQHRLLYKDAPPGHFTKKISQAT